MSNVRCSLAQIELLVSLQQQMATAFATLTATISKQSVENERLVTHIASPPTPKDKAPQEPHFVRWHPGRKAISITEWIKRCTENARLNRLSDDDTLAHIKLALSSASGDFEVHAPEVRNNLTKFKAWLQKQYQPLFPHHAAAEGR